MEVQKLKHAQQTLVMPEATAGLGDSAATADDTGDEVAHSGEQCVSAESGQEGTPVPCPGEQPPPLPATVQLELPPGSRGDSREKGEADSQGTPAQRPGKGPSTARPKSAPLGVIARWIQW